MVLVIKITEEITTGICQDIKVYYKGICNRYIARTHNQHHFQHKITNIKNRYFVIFLNTHSTLPRNYFTNLMLELLHPFQEKQAASIQIYTNFSSTNQKKKQLTSKLK